MQDGVADSPLARVTHADVAMANPIRGIDPFGHKLGRRFSLFGFQGSGRMVDHPFTLHIIRDGRPSVNP